MRQLKVHYLGLIICTFLLLAGCAGTQAAYTAAEGIDQTAKVVAEHYYAVVKEANALKTSGALAGDDLVKAQDLVRDTRPAIDTLASAAQVYEGVQSAETEAELEAAILKASTSIGALIDILKAARE